MPVQLRPAQLPDMALLRRSFSYDPATGIIQWKFRPDKDVAWNGHYANREAGCVFNGRGYRRIRINGRGFFTHRMAWILHYGSFPEGMFVDHINGDPSDNRIANLRLATSEGNNRNARGRRNGPKGVRHTRKGKFAAAIKVNGKTIQRGSYDTEDEAHEHYKRLALEHFGDFARFA